MNHLNFIGIENFKVFKDLNRFELKPITILVGTNSSGKSSLTKGMLTIKSSFENVSDRDFGRNNDGALNLSSFSRLGERGKIKISLHETEKLSFQSVPNLGNFSNCVNNKSNSPYISFELPIRFRPLEDTFMMRFTYKKSDNAIQDGVQTNVSITHLDTNTDILNFDGDKGEMKIKFSFLKERLDLEVRKMNEIQAIYNKIEELTVLHIKDNLPKEIELEITDLEKQQRKLFLNFSKHREYYDVGRDRHGVKLKGKRKSKPLLSFGEFAKECYNDYSPELYGYDDKKKFQGELEIIKNYYPDSTLINFPFVHNELIKSRNKFWDESKYKENELEEAKLFIESHISKNELIIQKLLSKTDMPIEYLKKLEMDSLDELVIIATERDYKSGSFVKKIGVKFLEFFKKLEEDNISQYNFPTSFLNSTKNDSDPTIEEMDGLMGQTINKMIEKEPLLDDTDYESSNQNIFNVIRLYEDDDKTEINNFHFFMKKFIFDGLNESINDVCKFYENIHYIPAIRTKIDRFFRIGERESYLQEVLYEFHQTKLSDQAEQFIDTYVRSFGIADSMELRITDDSVGTKIYLSKDGKLLELADVGYGVAQILPIILKLALLISEKKDPSRSRFLSVIIEEPETNLHPALQSKLADMFVECYQKYDIPLIIETHSEYLIRKLQYLTAKKEFAAKDSVIYYFNDPKNIPAGEKQVKKIEILEDGSLSDDFGSGFFDEATTWKFELMELRKAQKN
jgi:predicted ATPase